jgi:hypothetical protein
VSQSAPTKYELPSLQRAFARLGEPEATFTSRFALSLSLFVGGLLLLIASGVAVWWWWQFIVMLPALTALVVAPIIFGFAAMWFGYSLRASWFVCPGGVVRLRGSTAEACAWEDFRSIRQVKDQAAYTLYRKDGEPWELSVASTPEISVLGRMIRLKAEAHKVAWEVVEGK